jgi:hypothetical protein
LRHAQKKESWLAKRNVAAGLLSLLFVVLLFAADTRQENSTDHWVGTWASSPQLGDQGNAPPEPGFKDSTLRQIVRVSLGGKKIRVRFSNAFGRDPLTVTSAHVAIRRAQAVFRQTLINRSRLTEVHQ